MYPYAGVVLGSVLLALLVTLAPGVESPEGPARRGGTGVGDLQLARIYGELYRMPRQVLLDPGIPVGSIAGEGWQWTPAGGNGFWTRQCGEPATSSLVDTGFASSERGGAVRAEATCVYDTAFVVGAGTAPVRRCGRLGLVYGAGGGERYAGSPGGEAAATVSGELVSPDRGGSHSWKDWDWRPVLRNDSMARKQSVSGVYGRGVVRAAGGVAGGVRSADAVSPWRLQGHGMSGWTVAGVTTAGGAAGTNPRRPELFAVGANCLFDVAGMGGADPFVEPMGAMAFSEAVPGMAADSVWGAAGSLENVRPGLVADWRARLRRDPAALPVAAREVSYGGAAFSVVASPEIGLDGGGGLPAMPAGSGTMAYDARRGVLPAAGTGVRWRAAMCGEILELVPGSAAHELCAWRNW